MAELKTRVITRNDSTANWNAAVEAAGEDGVVLLKGETAWEFTEKGPKMKVGDGTTSWENLEYFGGEEAKTFQVGSLEEITETDLAVGDTAIVKTAIYTNAEDETKNKYSYTGYVWNGTMWAAMDGNYSAKNVIFDEDFTFTTKIGTVQTLTNGSAKVAAAGKSVKDFLAGIFAAEANPARTANASVSWTTEPKGTVEVGTEVTPTYNAKFNAGSYTYGPSTGLTATSWDIDIADLADANKTTNSGSFSKFTATDGMSGYAKITAKATHGDGAIPVTNIGNQYDADGNKNVRIMSGSKSATSAGYSSYRAWFYGYKNGDSTLAIADIDSDDIRGLTSANGSFTTSMATNKMQQMFFAAPAGKVNYTLKDDGVTVATGLTVAHSVNGAPQTVKYMAVYVKGAGNYVVDVDPETNANNNRNGMKYDLFYVSNDNPNSGEATYTITTTKN